jgi:outer membrane lipoprotein-sorting protein
MTRRLLPLTRALAIGAALALPLAGGAVLTAAHAQSAQDDLAAVNRAIRSITTLRADFTQTDRNGQVQSGKLLMKQPGHIRFDYGAGNDLLIVADGKSLYMVDYQVSQVQRWPIRNSPLGALLDPTRDITKYGKLVPTGDPRVVSIEVRDPAHPEYGAISLIFTRKASATAGLELYGWVARDAQGNRTSIRLTSLEQGTPIADSAFKWRDPRPNRAGPSR